MKSIQSNVVRHLGTHFPPALLSGEKDTKTKDAPTQFEFTAQWFASGMPHYQVTRNSPSGLYRFLPG
jgi:hypothetical protein